MTIGTESGRWLKIKRRTDNHVCVLPAVPLHASVGSIYQCTACEQRWRLATLPPALQPRDPGEQRPLVRGRDGAMWVRVSWLQTLFG